MKKKDEGFTLVELLIVIVILGILATIVVFAVRGITDQGQENACKSTAKSYEVAIEAWYAGGPTMDDADSDGHPTGLDLQTSGLIREYSDEAVQVTEGTGTFGDPGYSSSDVAIGTGDDCVGISL